ncbi:hypothetical protein GCM10010211_58760 [Streptomyces albospinus]|uniref:DNA-3-methyladenine glycosylase 2 family protein n=1 Tax=Streptomyces albospinus TaxID=285515 RepID=A0ABQ2VG80_9ACTN|nr:hypothetical protein [Streptomyces albospinus]GGU84977.1 hypothetical protein GCM10010211_58760 [Streptomyces albospinus]
MDIVTAAIAACHDAYHARGDGVSMRFNQSLADKLDATMLVQLLPDDAVNSLGRWLTDPERGRRYRKGSGTHTVPYSPSTWMAVDPWPNALADRTAVALASVSRADVVATVQVADQSESWAEAFVATQVWGYGLTGYGPYRTCQVLAQPGAEEAFAEAVSLLTDEGASAAYERLQALDGLGPAFLTKFLYFAGQALPVVKGPRPLILDSVLAGVLRRHATKVGTVADYEWAAAIANRIWRDSNWTSHRYRIYLQWMYAASEQLTAALIDWPAAPDVLELALFSAAWDPA